MFGLKRLPWATPQELRKPGILGINRRNGDYVLPNNPREHYPRVDDKALTKELCRRRQIPVPETYALIERHGDVAKFLDLIGHRAGICRQAGRRQRGPRHRRHRPARRQRLLQLQRRASPLADMTYHLMTILSGLYSLAGQPDRIIIEQRIIRHPVFESIAVGGTPDVRIILYRCVPVMAMVAPADAGIARAGRICTRGPSPRASTCTAGEPSAASAKTAPSPCIPTPASRSRGLEIPSGKICSSRRCGWPMDWRWAIWASISSSTPPLDRSCWKPTPARD